METHQYAISMMADMKATRRRWEEAEHRTKGGDEPAASLKNHRRFRPVFSRMNSLDAMGGTGIRMCEQEKSSR